MSARDRRTNRRRSRASVEPEVPVQAALMRMGAQKLRRESPTQYLVLKWSLRLMLLTAVAGSIAAIFR